MIASGFMNRIAAIVALCTLLSAPWAEGAEAPKRKPGQWQITMTSDNSKIPTRVEDVCLDEATEALLDRFALGASREMCSTFDWKNAGGGKASVDAVCDIGMNKVTIHGDIVFTGNTAYRQEIRTHYDPAPHGRGNTVSVNEGKWTGACAADMKPGDVVTRPSPTMPVSMHMNLNQMLKGEGR
jgi:hypothetical protein